MHETAFGDLTYELSPLLRVDRDLRESGTWILATGSGDAREMLRIEHPALLTWLAGLKGVVVDRDELVATCMRALSSPAEAAERIVDAFITAEVLADSGTAKSLRARGARWEEWGWRDAFDFHFSVRGQSFDRKDRGDYEATLRGLLDNQAESGPQPPAVKEVASDTVIDLAPFVDEFDATHRPGSIADALRATRPLNRFARQGIDAPSVAKMLTAAHGVLFTRELVLGRHLFKASPSGGARQPVEIYLAARQVEGIAPGIYHFHSLRKELRQVRDAAYLEQVDASGFDKGGIKTASAVLYVTYRFVRHSWKYRYPGTYRMVLMELGHNFQTTRLAAALAGLEVYYNPAIDDYLVSSLLDLGDDTDEGPMYCLGLGRGGEL